MEKTLDVIGIQMDFGASKRGVSMGPMAIRYGGLCQGLERLGYSVEDKGDIVPLPVGRSLPNLRNFEQVVDVNRRIYQAVRESLAQGHFPILLGGDHSIAAVPTLRLGGSITDAMAKLQKIREQERRVMGMNCGACGAPSCRALAEDVVAGQANEDQCIFLMREKLQKRLNSR